MSVCLIDSEMVGLSRSGRSAAIGGNCHRIGGTRGEDPIRYSLRARGWSAAPWRYSQQGDADIIHGRIDRPYDDMTLRVTLGLVELSTERMDVVAVSATPVPAVRLPIKDEGAVAVPRRQRPQAQWAVQEPVFIPNQLGDDARLGEQDPHTSPRPSGRPSCWRRRSAMHRHRRPDRRSEGGEPAWQGPRRRPGDRAAGQRRTKHRAAWGTPP